MISTVLSPNPHSGPVHKLDKTPEVRTLDTIVLIYRRCGAKTGSFLSIDKGLANCRTCSVGLALNADSLAARSSICFLYGTYRSKSDRATLQKSKQNDTCHAGKDLPISTWQPSNADGTQPEGFQVGEENIHSTAASPAEHAELTLHQSNCLSANRKQPNIILIQVC